jgi:DNA topoisomerase-1
MTTRHSLERQRVGRGFHYFDAGVRVTNKAQLKYFTSLHIPPAWRDVHIAASTRSRILATGNDKAGRTQYIYHLTFRARQEKAKFERILRFARALPELRRTTYAHLHHPNLDREKVLACIVRLMDEAYFRVGNETYAKDNHTYGITTLRSKHTEVKGNTITFDFMGKSGQHHRKHITNRTLANIVKQLDELPGYEIFKYYDSLGQLAGISSNDVNTYIKEIMGEEFSAKDFRTWGGTLLATTELIQAEHPNSKDGRKKIITTCIQKVAGRLGNTPAIARSSYIDPRIINAYASTDELIKMRSLIERIDQQKYFTSAEECVLQLLESKM